MPFSPILKSRGLPNLKLILLSIQTSQNGWPHPYSLLQHLILSPQHTAIWILSTLLYSSMLTKIICAASIILHSKSFWYFLLYLTILMVLLILSFPFPWFLRHHKLLVPLPFWQFLSCSFFGALFLCLRALLYTYSLGYVFQCPSFNFCLNYTVSYIILLGPP